MKISINEDILQNKRAEYGKQIVAPLSQQLTEKYGKNFEAKNLRRMMQFAEEFSDLEIVAPLARQLSWAHFRAKQATERISFPNSLNK